MTSAFFVMVIAIAAPVILLIPPRAACTRLDPGDYRASKVSLPDGSAYAFTNFTGEMNIQGVGGVHG